MSSDIRHVIAQRFRAARAASGLTLQEVTNRMGGSTPSRFSQWELGERSPKFEQILEASKVFGRSAAWLAGFVDDEFDGAARRYLPPTSNTQGIAGSQLCDSVAFNAEYLKGRKLRDDELLAIRAIDDLSPDIRKGDELLIHRNTAIDAGADLYAIQVGETVLACRVTLEVDGNYTITHGKAEPTMKTADELARLSIIGRVVRIARDL